MAEKCRVVEGDNSRLKHCPVEVCRFKTTRGKSVKIQPFLPIVLPLGIGRYD